MDGISSIERTEFVHDEPSESHCLAASQPESHGNHHFKAVHVIANPVVQPGMSHRFLFRQFGAPDKPCGVGRADANPKLLLNDT